MQLWQKITVFSSLILLPLSASAVPVTDEVDIGGAVRVNYGWKDYDDNAKLEFELFRADVNYKSKDGLFASAQYRWYENMDVVHHAYMGYQFDDAQSVQVGVTQVPFGLLPYAAHSFWFGATYYLGFEDDYDAGIHYKNEQDGWRYDLAYFVNDEIGDGSNYDRYSFDAATTADSPYEEAGQINARVEREFTSGEVTHKLGGSLQYSQLDFMADAATVVGEDTNGLAAAAHWQLDWKQWQLQLQYIHYDYDIDNSERIALSAFQYPFEIAAEADVATVNIAKSFDVDWGPITNLNFYNDYSQVMASGQGLDDSIQNVTGVAITAGKFYSYVDWIAGKNMWFVDGAGVGIDNGDTSWHSRLNINIGFYF
ncbi:hypothetical protein HNW13_008695 [Shewanella sp. BF02_Schw]|jgi:hypothetical protein|uniref:hypothetical protein n=1 Tax=unclassified Shewanella TaxID=196818 RepID=UPI001782E445|nr:hypothetical protein [Shewanella sp. BF02_Schw]MBO1895850.1 hypothetical protein [Shewanella sp. BF02_Schw]